MGGNRPLISVIIVNLNGEAFLRRCLSSLFTPPPETPFEVVLVDNASTDRSLEIVQGEFPSVRVIRNGRNLGFARGNNQGIEASAGEFVLTLNNDTEAGPGFIDALGGAALASAPDFGMWAPKILSMEDRTLIDSAGGLLIYRSGLAKGRARLQRDRGQYETEEEVLMPSACAGLYRRALLDDVGAFDEEFFAYCEDTDLGLRARLAGWRALYVPRAVVYHHYSGTGGRYTPFKAYLAERNHICVVLKDFPARDLALAPAYEAWRYCLEVYGLLARRGAGARYTEDFSAAGLLFVLLRAYWGALRLAPRMLRQRRRVRQRTRVTAREVGSWFRRFGLSASTLVLRD